MMNSDQKLPFWFSIKAITIQKNRDRKPNQKLNIDAVEPEKNKRTLKLINRESYYYAISINHNYFLISNS